ncbi:MAG: hypothetical protein R6V19_04530, partial [Armatimonadota bacterium]
MNRRQVMLCVIAVCMLQLLCMLAHTQPISQGPRGLIHRGIGPDGVGDLPFPNETIWMRHGGAQALKIEAPNHTDGPLEGYTISLSLPAGYELMDPAGRHYQGHYGRNMPAVTFGTDGHRQTVTLAFDNPIPIGDMETEKHNYVTVLVLRASGEAVPSGKLAYDYRADGWKGPAGEYSVRLLPDLPGVVEKPQVLMCPVVWYGVHFNDAEYRALLKTVREAGFDTVHFSNYRDRLVQNTDSGTSGWLRTFVPSNRQKAAIADELGFRIICSCTRTWGRDYFEFDGAPEHLAIGPDGEPVEDIPCLEWFITEGYHRHHEMMATEMDLHHADAWMRGNELGHAWEKYCFCDRCRKAFAEEKNIPEAVDMTGEEILEEYPDEWLDFRCRQYARVCQQLREGAYKARPGSLFGIYSGLQDPICKKRYTTDWRYLGKSCDYAVGTIGSFEVTHEALGDTPLMGREGIYHFPTYQYNVSRLMRTYVDSGGYGLRMFSLHYYDGQILQGAAKLSRFMAQSSDIPMNHHRQDDLASSADEKLQARVLVGEGGRRLIVL